MALIAGYVTWCCHWSCGQLVDAHPVVLVSIVVATDFIGIAGAWIVTLALTHLVMGRWRSVSASAVSAATSPGERVAIGVTVVLTPG